MDWTKKEKAIKELEAEKKEKESIEDFKKSLKELGIKHNNSD